MADVDARKPATEAGDSKEPVAAWWKPVLLARWVVALVVASLVVHGALFLLLRKSAVPQAAPVEQTVGTFRFVAAGEAHPGPAKFDLHIRFIDDLEKAGRQRLAAHQFRVRESVENLLRKSQSVELSDQAFARLKHEIQEQIDDALDLRAVAEVIITNLDVEATGGSALAPVAADHMPPGKTAEPTAISVGN